MSSAECSLKSLTSPNQGELLQSHNSLTFKLLKTVADFSQALATLHDRFGHELQMLVETFRKRNGELRKERLNCPNGLFQIWELFLQQVEVNSQQHGDISRDLSQSLGNGLIERLFHRKIQSKKVFAHKERIEAILVKSSELLDKCYKDYCQAYAMALTDPAQYLSEYIASHNVYVHQLQATNGMVHAYQTKTLPRLLEELEDCHLDTSSSISSSLLNSSELISEKSSEQVAGYQNLALACKQANHRNDLAQFVKSASSNQMNLLLQNSAGGGGGRHHAASGGAGNESQHHQHSQQDQDNQTAGEQQERAIKYHQFHAASLQQAELEAPASFDAKNLQIVPTFKNEIAPDFSQPPDQQQPKLELDRESLEEKIAKFEERIESLGKLLARSHESKLHNKTNELQDELCQRKFDLYVAQIHLSAVRSQLQLFEYNFRPLSSIAGLDNALVDYQELANAGQGALGAGGTGGAGSAAAAAAAAAVAAAAGSSSGGAQVRRSPQSTAAAAAQSGAGLLVGGGAQMDAPLGYRSKWIKAFKSLKETPGQPQSAQKFADFQLAELADSTGLQMQGPAVNNLGQQHHQQQQQQQQLENLHHFQEYTFKKIASCDVCKDFLRGHMRQGVKCKLCKISCHNDCQTKAHGTIKCQQPKIKLLRRQKSAGELEVSVNSDENTDPSERVASSKPDSIYSLIRQVLDAKKRGQHNSHAPATPSSSFLATAAAAAAAAAASSSNNSDDYNHLRANPFANSPTINLSTGNLALANANGKSVSTSALQSGGGARLESSVDRWSVVMELLAQSRRSTRELQRAADPEAKAEPGAKRHSKQLDKFKLAARSVGKHQRYQTTPAPLSPGSPQPPQSQASSGQQQQQGGQLSPTGQHVGHPTIQPEVGSAQYGAGSGRDSSQLARPARPSGVPKPPGEQQQQQQQQQQQPQHSSQLLIQHTKSLPVGQVAPGQQLHAASHRQFEPQPHPHHPPIGIMSATPPQTIATYAGDSSAPPGASGADLSMLGQHHLGQTMSSQHQYQLLDLQQQQLQSTSEAPHSPQRKRFNLRMKSFSLDSPESPQVAASSTLAHSQQAAGSMTSCDQTGVQVAPLHYGQHQSSEQFQQQHHQLNHHHQAQRQHQQPNRAVGLTYEQRQQQQQQDGSYSQMPFLVHSAFFYRSNAINGQQEQQLYGRQAGATLRPLRAGGGGADAQSGQRQTSAHQPQQHRHSYHNQSSSSSNYRHYAAAAAAPDNSNPLTSCGDAQLALAGNGGRQCSSQSSLNIHSIAPGFQALQDELRGPASLSTSSAPSAPNNNSGSSNIGAKNNAGNSGGVSANSNANHSSSSKTQQSASSAASSEPSTAGNSQGGYQAEHVAGARQNQEADYYDHHQLEHHQHHGSRVAHHDKQQLQLQQQTGPAPLASTNTFVVLYDYAAQRGDELQLNAGQLVQVLDTSERDWWKVCALDGSNRLGYFPSSYLAQLYQNERPLQVAQTIQVSNGETCDKLLRGQIVIHTGKQMDNFVTIRTVRPNGGLNEAQTFVNYIQCPQKYLLDV